MERPNSIVLPKSTLTSEQTIGECSSHQWYQDDGCGRQRTAGRPSPFLKHILFEEGQGLYSLYCTKMYTLLRKS